MRIRVDHCKCPTYMGNLLAWDKGWASDGKSLLTMKSLPLWPPRPPLHEPGLIFNPGQHATGGYFFILFT